MIRKLIGSWGLVGLVTVAWCGLVDAAELAVKTHVAPARCGPCGCLERTSVYHPDLQSTYGLLYDPRNFDTTEPYYYLGPVRRHLRFYVDGVPAPGTC
jgi:hypothetical protein